MRWNNLLKVLNDKLPEGGSLLGLNIEKNKIISEISKLVFLAIATIFKRPMKNNGIKYDIT